MFTNKIIIIVFSVFKERSMKSLLFLIPAVIIFLSAGCKYDVAEPQWDQTFNLGAVPEITQIEPAGSAAPGVNYITIYGKNFNSVPDDNGVLFDNLRGNVVSAEILEKSGTEIKVRRPNFVSDSCIIKIIPDSAYVPAKSSIYKVDQVYENYGSFLDNLQLAVLAADNSENLYVVEYLSKTIYKISNDGVKTELGSANRAPTEARFGPDGNLYLLGSDRRIDKVDITTETVTQWTQLPQGKVAKFGDFGGNYLYAGQNSGLFIVRFDSTSIVTSSGFYSGEEILAVRAFSGYLYVASRVGSSPAKICKHEILSDSLGSQEIVLDMNSTDSVFSSRIIKGITFSSDGNIFIATDAENPILYFNPLTSELDFFYKAILPAYCKYFAWGSQYFIYMISGNNDPAQTWDVFKIDAGTTGEP